MSTSSTHAQARPARGAYAALRQLFGLFKLRIGVVIALTALTGVAIQPGSALSATQTLAVFLAVLLASASAGAFNQYYEVDLDANMRRTRGRPFITGRYVRHPAWLWLIVAMTVLGVGLAWLTTNFSASIYTFLGAFFYAIVYTVWLKRRTWWNIIIGGAAGSFAVLAGAAAVSPALSPQALLLALILLLWTPPHFWSLAIVYRDDYAGAGVPMLPVVKGNQVTAWAILAHTVTLVLLSWWLATWMGPVYLLAAVGGGVLFIHASWVVARTPTVQTARRCFFASLAQLSLLLLGILIEALLR